MQATGKWLVIGGLWPVAGRIVEGVGYMLVVAKKKFESAVGEWGLARSGGASGYFLCLVTLF
jgi:hypothetical protein